jgi:chemotaxis family two-component system response regulator Rcp1
MSVVLSLDQPASRAPLPVTPAEERVGPDRAASPRRHFVLVEDNPADIRLFERRMRERDPDLHVSVLRDGATALEFLDQVIEGTVPRPDLLILDLSLPVVRGWRVLRYVKRSPLLRFLPVVVLSNSKAPQDVERAYREGAASYIHKGRDLDGFLRAVDAVDGYWCGIVDLPGDSGHRH